MMHHNSFPLVADGEPILVERVSMSLYDEADLISNIKGDYQDRFDTVAVQTSEVSQPLETPVQESPVPSYSRREQTRYPAQAVHEGKTAGQLAREASREDIKKKRSAAYLQQEVPSPGRVFRRPSTPAREVAESRTQSLARAAERLQQDSYILVDVPKTYSLDKEDRLAEPATTTPKNSYDFLKKSQVYNYPERTLEKQRQVAQELNLQQIEEELHG